MAVEALVATARRFTGFKNHTFCTVTSCGWCVKLGLSLYTAVHTERNAEVDHSFTSQTSPAPTRGLGGCGHDRRRAAYLGAVVVHGQHAEHVQCVSALDELPHGVGHGGALAPLHRGRRLVAGRIGQLVHADDAVLREMGTEFDLTKDQRGAFLERDRRKTPTSSGGAATTSM